MFKLKRLGASFGLTMLAGLASGKDARTSFREAGIGALAEQVVDDEKDFSSGVAEAVAHSIQLARQIDRPVELPLAKSFDPTEDDFDEAKREVEALIDLPTVELLEIDTKLHEFEEGIVEARKVVFEARRAKLRKENLDK